jgi:hypothetical protein
MANHKLHRTLATALSRAGLPTDLSQVIGRHFVFEVPKRERGVPEAEGESDRFLFGTIVGGKLDARGFLALMTNLHDVRDGDDGPASMTSVATPIVIVRSSMSYIGGKYDRSQEVHWCLYITSEGDAGGDGRIPGKLTIL